MINVTGLTKYYGEHIALRDVNFEIREGECVGFLGRNGAGKSTVLKVLATALLPSAGAVKINGLDVVENPDAVRTLLGFLPEDPPLYPEMKVYAYLEFLGLLRGVPDRDIGRRIGTVAEKTGISDVLDDTIETLSLGYKKRVGIAQTIVHDPKLVIVDEPISGLDPVQIVEIRELVRSLRGEHTVLLSSHILTELSQTCDRFLVIEQGSIVARGTEEELLESASRHQVFDLEVRGTQEQLESLLAEVNEVVSHTILSAEGDFVRARLKLSQDVPDKIAAKVVGAGLGLRALGPQTSDLESIFVELTGRKAA